MKLLFRHSPGEAHVRVNFLGKGREPVKAGTPRVSNFLAFLFLLHLGLGLSAGTALAGNAVPAPMRKESQAPPIQITGADFPVIAPAFPPLTGYTAVPIGRDSSDFALVRQHWSRVVEEHDPEKAFGPASTGMTAPVLRQWQNLGRLMPGWGPEEQLRHINGFFNRWGSKRDQDNYDREEYWATPEEFLENGGDCEDFAIAKYMALRYFGWSEEALWILLVKENASGENHAVLLVKTGNRNFILDNLTRPVYLLILEPSFTSRYTPLCAVNGRGLWAMVQKKQNGKGEGKKTGEPGGLERENN